MLIVALYPCLRHSATGTSFIVAWWETWVTIMNTSRPGISETDWRTYYWQSQTHNSAYKDMFRVVGSDCLDMSSEPVFRFNLRYMWYVIQIALVWQEIHALGSWRFSFFAKDMGPPDLTDVKCLRSNTLYTRSNLDFSEKSQTYELFFTWAVKIWVKFQT